MNVSRHVNYIYYDFLHLSIVNELISCLVYELGIIGIFSVTNIGDTSLQNSNFIKSSSI